MNRVLIISTLLLFCTDFILSLHLSRLISRKTSVVGAIKDEISTAVSEKELRSTVENLVADASNKRNYVKQLTGCYEILDTVGEPTWRKYSRFLVRNNQCKNYQIFGKNGNFINLSEYSFLGCFATASGTCRKSKLLKNTFEAQVDKVVINFGSRLSIPLNVTGTGTINLLYSSPTLRIVANEEAAIAIQVPKEVPSKYRALLSSRGIEL